MGTFDRRMLPISIFPSQTISTGYACLTEFLFFTQALPPGNNPWEEPSTPRRIKKADGMNSPLPCAIHHPDLMPDGCQELCHEAILIY